MSLQPRSLSAADLNEEIELAKPLSGLWRALHNEAWFRMRGEVQKQIGKANCGWLPKLAKGEGA